MAIGENGNVELGVISTGIDRFMRKLHQRKRVELSKISKELNIPEDTVEYWSYILENQGLLRIDYTLTTVYLSWIARAMK